MKDEARQYTLDTNVFTQASGQYFPGGARRRGLVL